MLETGLVFPEKITGSSCLWSAAGCNALCAVDSGPLVPHQYINIYG